MGQIIVVASGKGGVGKTTVTARLGEALSKRDKKVLLVDTDIGLRNLDLALGVENEVFFDVLDCLDERCKPEDAIIGFPDKPNLFFMPAAQSRGGKHLNADKLAAFCRGISENYDYIFLDAPAGISDGFYAAAACCDSAVVVTQPHIASVRDADRCVDALMKNGLDNISLIINGIKEEYVKSGLMMNADDVVDLLGVKLLGIVPFDSALMRASSDEDSDYPAKKAFDNIAGRILGEKIAAMDISDEKKSFIKKFAEAVFKKKMMEG